jgi:hypothetical protein
VERRLKKDQRVPQRAASLAEFYPYDLAEHANSRSRALHVAGTGGAIALAMGAAVTKKPQLLLAAPVVGYGFAWLGQYLFEHNKPATFRQPLYSLACDFLMLRDVLRGRLALIKRCRAKPQRFRK